MSLQDGPSSSSLQAQHDDDDSDDEPSEKKKRYGRLNTATTKTKRRLAAVHTRTASLYTVKIQDPLDSLYVPDDLNELDLYRVSMYKSGVRAVTSKPTRFTDDMKCAICNDKHKFDQCPVLANPDFLRTHFIQFCVLHNKIRKLLTKQVMQVKTASPPPDIEDQSTDDDDDASVEQDFHQGEE